MKKQNLLFLTCGIILFLCVGLWAMSGASAGFDTSVYMFLQSFPKTYVQPFFMFITRFGDPLFCVILLLCITILFYKRIGMYAIGIGLFDVLLNQILKYIFCRPRPSVEHLVHASGYSFPSGHTMIAMMLYGFLLYVVYTKMKHPLKNVLYMILLFLIVCIPISRIYLGVHYATDIVGGLIVGFSFLCAYISIVKEKLKNM